MLTYLYLNDLFSNILAKSKVIEGRFYICPKGGNEINSDEFKQILEDTFNGTNDIKKFPASFLLPPVSSGRFTGPIGEWELYRLTMFFLQPSFIDGNNQTKNRNPKTGTSRHSIPEDWHDMKRAAIGFIRMLDNVIKLHDLHNSSFRLGNNDRFLEPVSLVGNKVLSGIKLEFSAMLYINCVEALEDYSNEAFTTIIIPERNNIKYL